MSRGRRARREGGQAITELALTLPLLLLVLVLAVDVARLLYVSVMLQEAAQEGAVYGGRYPTAESTIIARVRSSSNAPEVTGSSVSVNCSASPAPGTVRVNVVFDLALLTPIIADLLGSPVRLTGTSSSTNFEGTCGP